MKAKRAKQRNPNIRKKSLKVDRNKTRARKRKESLQEKTRITAERNEQRRLSNAVIKKTTQPNLKINEKQSKRESIESAQREVNTAKTRQEVEQSQQTVQNLERELLDERVKAEQQKELAIAINERDSEEQPKLTGLLNTNAKILEVLTKFYQKNTDDQDTTINTPGKKLPKKAPVKSKGPKSKPETKEEDGDMLSTIIGLLTGGLGSLLSGALFKNLMKFSPMGKLFKYAKSLRSLLSRAVIAGLKYIGKIGVKSLKSIVKFVISLMPYAKQILKMLTSMTVSTVAKVAKRTASAASNLVTKSGGKVAAKLGNKIALKAGAKLAGRAAAASVPIAGWVVTAGLTAVDAVEGWKAAGESLGIKEDELTATNKFSGALSSVLTLGMGSDTLAKSINETFGGPKTTLIKRYENNNVIEHNTFSPDKIDWGEISKLDSKAQMEVLSIDEFSAQDTKRLETLIIKTIKMEQSHSSTVINKDNSKNTVVNTTETFNKLLAKRDKKRNFNYLVAKGTGYNKYNSPNKGTSYTTENPEKSNNTSKNSIYGTKNPNVSNSTDKKEEPDMVNNQNIYSPIFSEEAIKAVDDLGVDRELFEDKKEEPDTAIKFTDFLSSEKSPATSNKAQKENIIDNSSKSLVETEVSRTELINAQLQQVSIQQATVQHEEKDPHGSDRALNLFADLL